MWEECKGRGIQPMAQERRHDVGQPGRASVTGSPDSCGIHSLIGAIDPPATSLVRFCPAKKALSNSYSH